MISVSTLYCGSALSSHQLRYGKEKPAGPIVVYNCTAKCNLTCTHCYAAGFDGKELSTAQIKALLDDLAQLGSPAILFSGGEPLTRKDLPELVAYASSKGVRPTISTNGTLITPAIARQLAEAKIGYVGISIDGLAETHNKFRGLPTAFDDAMRGIGYCQAEHLKVGLRMTLTRYNVDQVEGVFKLMAERKIPRICFYHLVYSGRGKDIMEADLSAQERRRAVDLIIDQTRAAFDAGRQIEVLTVDNHADGPYLYLRLLRENPEKAAETMDLLQLNGGNASGVRLGCIRPNGDVLPDQFWSPHVLGNVHERKFSEIWLDKSNAFLTALRQRPRPVKGRCLTCRFMDICNGNFRARAEAMGDLWGEDPACYLTDEEIAK